MRAMKPITRDIIRAVIVLAGIALVAGLLLGVVYPLTRLSAEELEARAKKPLPGIYAAESYSPVGQDGGQFVDFCFKAEKAGEEDAYIVVARGEGGYGGEVQMYVVFQGDYIIKLAKGVSGETPGVSDKAFKDSYYNQFYENDVTTLVKFVFDKHIDAATGATKSSMGILNAVNNALKFYTDYILTEGV